MTAPPKLQSRGRFGRLFSVVVTRPCRCSVARSSGPNGFKSQEPSSHSLALPILAISKYVLETAGSPCQPSSAAPCLNGTDSLVHQPNMCRDSASHQSIPDGTPKWRSTCVHSDMALRSSGYSNVGCLGAGTRLFQPEPLGLEQNPRGCLDSHHCRATVRVTVNSVLRPARDAAPYRSA